MSETRKDSKIEIKEAPVKTVSVVIIRGDKILTVRHKAGTTAGEGVTGLPGGRQKENESEEDAAVREVSEETGLQLNKENLFQFPGNFFEKELNFNGNKKNATMKVFICQDFTGELVDETDKTRPEWVLLSAISKGLYETPANVLEAVKNANDFLLDSAKQ